MIIFDCDGVLVDSEVIANKSQYKILKQFTTYPETFDQSFQRFLGLNDKSLQHILKQEFNIDYTDEHVEEFHKDYESRFVEEGYAIPGITRVLDLVEQAAVAKCIASNGHMERIHNSLKVAKLSHYFQDIYSATMVENGKPDPALFLHAAQDKNVHPENCLVIEDSVAGITAAKAANMKVIGFLASTHGQYDWYQEKIRNQEPWRIAHDADELIQHIREFKGI